MVQPTCQQRNFMKNDKKKKEQDNSHQGDHKSLFGFNLKKASDRLKGLLLDDIDDKQDY